MKNMAITIVKWKELFGALCLLIGMQANAQSPIYFSSGHYANPNSFTQASAALMGTIVGTNIHTTTPNGIGNQYFRFYSATTGGTTYEPNGGADILLNSSTSSPLQITGSGKAYYLNIANAASNVVFKTNGSGTPGTSTVVAFEVQGAIRTVTSVTQAPLASYCQPNQNVSITANLSGSLSTGQAVYLRYSTSAAFVTSTVVAMTGGGTAYNANIPALTNTAGTTVYYYVFTSGPSGVLGDGSNADLYTINLNNNGGSNYSYTVLTPSAIYLHNFNDGATASPYNTSPTATSGTPTGIFNSNLNTSSWTSSIGSFTNFTGSSGQSIVVQPTNGTASTMTLTFNVNAGYQCSIQSFDFWRQRSSANGPTINSITINGTTVAGAITVPTTGAALGTTTVSNAVNNLTGTITVVISLSAPTAVNQNFRLDDFTLNGTITPLAVIAPSVTGFTVAAPGSGTSGYVGNTITVTGSGFIGTTQVKVGGAAGTLVSGFTVVNNNTITFPAIYAGGTIYVANGLGSSTSAASYTNLGFISTASTDWNTASTWLGGSIPTGGSNITIAHAVGISAAVAANPGNIIINAGSSLTLNNAASSVVVSIAVTNNGTLAFTAAGTLFFAGGGSLVNNATFTAGTGLVFFLGIGTVSGTIAFNNVTVAGGVNFGTGATVNGNLTINSGGFLNGNSVTYGNASTLIYNTTSNPYNIGFEWTGGSGVQPTVAGLGVPNNVSISSTNNVTTSGARGLAGNLSITNGNLTLGNDLFVSGNWSRTSGAFTPSGKAVWFNGNVGQTISTGETFNFLLINNSNASGVVVNTGLTVTVDGSTGDPFQLLNTGPFGINGTGAVNLTNNGGNIRVTGGVRTIQFNSATATMTISGTKTVASTSSGTLQVASSVSGGSLRLSAGVDFGASLTTIQNNAFLVILNGGFVNTNPVTYATGSTLSFRTGNLYNILATDKTWAPGTTGLGVPDKVELNASSTVVTISDNRTAITSITINTGNTLNNNSNTLTVASAITTAATALNMLGGTLNNNGGTLNIGPSGGGNQTFNMGTSATLNINGGSINLNGNLVMSGTLNQSGGLIAIDANSGIAATSTAQGTDHFAFANTSSANCTAGTIRFVDPPHSSYAANSTRSIQLRGVTGASYFFSGTHLFEFGDGTSTTSGNADGFAIECFAGTNRIALNNVTVNAGNASGRWVSSSYGASTSFGTFIQGTLTINANAEMRIGNTGSIFSLAGNLVNNGTLTSTASNTQFLLASITSTGNTAPGANANVQSISGSGTFRNLTASPTANFTGLTINNNNATVPAVTMNIGSVSFSGTLTLTAGVLDPGSANDISFTSTGTNTRTNGFVLRNGTGYMKKAIPSGASSFTFMVGDNTGTAEYSPITLNFSANSIARTIGTRLNDATHPQINNPTVSIDYLSRYWEMFEDASGGTYSYTAAMTYIVATDVNGTESNIVASFYNGSGWTLTGGSIASPVLTSGTLTQASIALNGMVLTGRASEPVYYRSIVTSGNWNIPGSWETSYDPAFISPAPVTATVAPNNNNSAGITIRNGHTITVVTAVTADDVNVASGGILTIGAGGSFTLANGGATTDFTVDGSSNFNNTVTLSAGSNSIINGTVRATVSPTASGTITVTSTGTYEHAIDGGTVPTCTWNPAIPGVGATLKITGLNASSTVGGLSQNFYHLEFNSPSQNTASLQILGDINTINGNLTMASSGTRQVRLFGNNPASNVGTLLTIYGNLNVTGGSLGLMNSGTTSTASCTIRVKGNMNISGGTFDMTGSSTGNTGTSSNLELEGNLTVSGTGSLVRTQNTTSNITFLRNAATPVQVLTSTATGINAGNINWFIGTGSTNNTVQLASDCILNASATLQVRSSATLFTAGEFIVQGGTFNNNASGTLRIGSQYGITTGSGATAGNIQTTTRSYTAGCNFTYGSTSANQATGNGLPTTITGILAIANTGGAGNNTVTLTTNNTTATTFNLSNGLFAAGAGQQLNIASGGTVNASSGNFATGATAGILNFPGSGAFTGSCTPYNVFASGAVNFGSGTVSIQNGGMFRINTGGSVATNAPFYSTGSTLQYNSGTTYARNLEWSATSGRGYPHHVNIQNTTALDLSANGDADRICGGDLILGGTGSGALNMGAMTSDLQVRGNILIGNGGAGTLNGSSIFGADVYVGRNWTRTATGTFNHNFRAVFFNGSAGVDQTVDASGAGGLENFPYLVINKTDNRNVVLATGTNVLVNGGNGTGAIFELLNGGLDLNRQTFTFNSYGNGLNGFLIDGLPGNLTRNIISTGGQGQFAFTHSDAVQRVAVISRKTANAALLSFSANVLIPINATGVGFGGVDFGNTLSTVNGTLQLNSKGFVFTNPPTYGNNSLLQYNSTGTYNRAIEWSTTSGPGYPFHVQVSNSTTVDLGNGTPAVVRQCAGNLTIDNGSVLSMDITPMTAALTVNGSLQIGNGASGTLTLSSLTGGDLNVGGSWTRNAGGVFNHNNRNVSFIGSTAGTITASGGETFPYLFLAKTALGNSVSLADNVVVSKELTLTSGTLNLANKNVIIPSNASATACIKPVLNPANVSINYSGSGKFFIERYMPARRAWRLMTAPFNPASGGLRTISEAWQEGQTDFSSAADTIPAGFATQITGGSIANGFDQSVYNNSSIKYYSAGSWMTPGNTNNTGVNSQEGWMLFVRGDRKNFGVITNQYKTPTTTTLRPRGQIHIGNKSITSSGLTVVGNPYASAIDYTTLTKTGALAGTNTYYLWDPYLGGTFGVGAFVTMTWNGTVFVPSAPLTGTGSSSIDNRYIPSGAAMLVDFGAGGTLTFKETDKNNSNSTVAFRSAGQLQTILQTVEPDGSLYTSDGNLVFFDRNFSNAVDRQDAIKPSNFSENFGLLREGKFLSVERRLPVRDRDTLFFHFEQPKLKQYRLLIMANELKAATGTAAFVEDQFLKTKIPVNMQDSTFIPFKVTTETGSWQPDRFRLVFHPVVKFLQASAQIEQHNIQVNWSIENEWNIHHYSIERSVNNLNFSEIGTVLANNASSAIYRYQFTDNKPQPGTYYYRIKCFSNNGVWLYSETMEITIRNSDNDWYVFPNPAAADLIQLQCNNQPSGTLNIRLLAMDGSELMQTNLFHPGGTATYSIRPKQHLTSGVYVLEMKNRKLNKTLTLSVFIK